MMKDIAIPVMVEVVVPAVQTAIMKTETGGKGIMATIGLKEIVIGGIVQKVK